MKMKFINESVSDFLKPKDKKQIIEDLSNDILLKLLNGYAISFFKNKDEEFKWNIYKSSFNIDKIFNEYHKLLGSGLFVSIYAEMDNYPLQHIFPNNVIYTNETKTAGTIQFFINKSELNLAINELVSAVLTSKIGHGFHIKYFHNIN